MSVKVKVLVWVISILFITACEQQRPDYDEVDNTLNNVTPLPEPLPQQPPGPLPQPAPFPQAQLTAVKDLLTAKCASCHGATNLGNINYITDALQLVAKGKVIPGNPAASPVFTRTNSGSMPPGAPLDAASIKLISDWILAGAPDFNAPAPAPGPTPAPTPAPAPNPSPTPVPVPPGNNDVEAAAYQALLVSCNGCHNANTNAGGFGFVLDAQKMRDGGMVIAGNSAASKLYQQIAAGLMPLGGNLDAASATAIRQWIDAGAKDFGGVALPPPPLKNIITQDTLTLIFNNLRLLNAFNRPNFRYLTLTHIYRSTDLQLNQKALFALAPAKALNSVHWRTRLVAPVIVDADKTLVRIDLRNYDITPAEWEAIVANYPYRSVLDRQPLLPDIAAALGTQTPVVRADWFVREILTTQYKALLELPDNIAQVEQRIGVDAVGNMLSNRVLRIGVEDSGVSFSNRVFERHQGLFGAYWKSYDFETSAGTQNIFQNPLGPSANSTAFAFTENGGEMIFTLPGGLHGYYLSEANGNFIPLGPRQIVQDSTREDRNVVNGVSCFTCHTAGIIPRKDEVRAASALRFRGNTLLKVQLQYPSDDVAKAQIDADIAAYVGVLARLGINGSGEPVSTSTLFYDDELTTAQMAAELDVSKATMELLLRTNGNLRRALGLQSPTAPVTRINFERNFRDIAIALGVGR